MALIDLIKKEHIAVPLRATDKPSVLEELINLLDAAGSLSSRDDALMAVTQREAMGTTGLESGIAIPHGKTDAVKDMVVALGISPGGIEFDALDGLPSKIFFCILAPPDKSGPHIEALSEIARMARSAAFLRMLASAESAEEVLELFEGD